jgi:hypothetical protein
MFLGEECCFFANQPGIVREDARQLLERIKAKNRETFWSTGRGGEAGPTHCVTLTIAPRALCDNPRQVHSQPDGHC